MPMVRLEGVTKRFGPLPPAVDDVSLDIARGAFFALLGPSGCGKTTLLRLIAGFEAPDAGRILIDGADVTRLPPHRRPVNMMFQSYALFPHLSVASNIGFGLVQEGVKKSEIAARVADMLRLVQLEGLGQRRPHQLSGGQKQRVALARALIKRPKLLLLDEPLAALDRRLRDETQFELMQLQAKLDLTFVLVTHDQREAMVMAQCIAVMRAGRLAQVGTPAQIYETPNSLYVAEFVGETNVIAGTVVSSSSGTLTLATKIGELSVMSPAAAAPGRTIQFAVRPERIALGAELAGPNCFPGEVADHAYGGDVSLYRVRVHDGHVLRVVRQNVGAATALRRGDAVNVHIAPDAGVILEGS